MSHDYIYAACLALAGVIFTILKDKSVRREQTRLEEKSQARIEADNSNQNALALVQVIRDTYSTLGKDTIAAHESMVKTLEWYMREYDEQKVALDEYRAWASSCTCGAIKGIAVVQSISTKAP